MFQRRRLKSSLKQNLVGIKIIFFGLFCTLIDLYSETYHLISYHTASPGNWLMIRSMMMNSRRFRDDKMIDPLSRKRKRKLKKSGKSSDGRFEPFVPIILHLNIKA